MEIEEIINKEMLKKQCEIINLKEKNLKLQQELEGRKKLCDLRYNQIKELQNSKYQIAIQELEKLLKDMFEGKCQSWFDKAKLDFVMNSRDKELIDYINGRIKELKGGII